MTHSFKKSVLIISLLSIFMISNLIANDMVMIMGKGNHYISNRRGAVESAIGVTVSNSSNMTKALALYPRVGDNTLAGNTMIYGQAQPIENDRRWARGIFLSLLATDTSTGINVADVHYPYNQLKQIWYQQKQTESLSELSVNPWVYRYGGRSFTFMLSGAGYEVILNHYIANNQHLVDAGITDLINDPNTGELSFSGLTFAVLMMHIKEANWDILRGIRNALEKGNLWMGADMNFILADGYEAFAYRSPSANSTLTYYYNSWDVIIANTITGDWTLDQDELVYIPVYGDGINFKNFSSPDKSMDRNASVGWNWHGFPVHPDKPGDPVNFYTFKNAYSDNAYIWNLGPMQNKARQLYYEDTHFHFYFLNDWQHSSHAMEKSSHPNLGMKIEMTETVTASLYGRLQNIEPYSYDFLPGETYWVTYNLYNEQSVYKALGSYVNNIEWVKSENWMILPNQANRVDRALEFGKMYEVKLKNDAQRIVNFQWTDSRVRPTIGRNMASEVFTYDMKQDYEAIDILSLTRSSAVECIEIGVFVGETCIGAVAVEELPVQILAYTQGHEGQVLNFRALYPDGIVSVINPVVQSFNRDSNEYEPTVLIAGQIGYATVQLDDSKDLSNTQIPAFVTNHSVYPNPFNPSTTINFSLSESTPVTIDIYNIKGQKVSQVYSGVLPAGNHFSKWDGLDENKQTLSSGIYFYRISTNNQVVSGKMILMK